MLHQIVIIITMDYCAKKNLFHLLQKRKNKYEIMKLEILM